MAFHLFYNATFFHLDESDLTSDAIIVENELIMACGAYEDLAIAWPQAKQINLKGTFVLPGFNDAHIHLWKVGSLMSHIVDLRGFNSKEKVLDALKSAGEKNPHRDEWILARGFNEAMWEVPSLPDIRDLDTVFPDRPCQIMRTCAHIVIVNSFTLKRAGIDKDTPDPEGGMIGHFENGEPNGILYESALKLISVYIPEITEKQYKRMILDAQEECLGMGITSITDPEIYQPQLKAYEELEKEGLLKIRINLFPVHLPALTPVKPKISKGKCDRKLQIDTVKFFADGGLSGQTAALFRPYLGSENNGILRMERDYFFKRAMKTQEKGWKIATHAIGDAAIEQVISIYKDLKKEENNQLCHRIEHLGLPQEKNLQDMQELGIIAVSQPAFVRELGPNFRQYLDEEYQKGIYPYQKILNEKVTLAFSSDAPVVKDFRPLTGIKDSMERKDLNGFIHNKEEKVSMKNAFLAYTKGGAMADGQAGIKGELAPGFLADFIVLDKNPFSTSLDDWENIQVLEVFIGGESVFNKENKEL